jgi:DNA-binding LacI/PurR family transcriptional regulator
MSTRVTIKDIAREAGVSAQTVSRVINQSPNVSPETRSLVETLIKDMDYQPNVLARSLVLQSSMTIGVLVSSLKYTGPHLFLTGTERQASELGYNLSLSLIDEPTPDCQECMVQALLSQQVTGIVWMVPEFGDNYEWWRQPEQRFLLERVPIVFMNSRPTPGFTVVAPDDRYGSYLAVNHLLDRGYRNIGIITGPSDGWESQQRRLGWQNALVESGIIPEPAQIAVGNWSAESGHRGFRQLTDQFPEMDAVYVSGDHMALGAYHAAREIGVHIPDDVAVVGHDNWAETAFYSPPLTTINRQHIEVGKLAVRELHRIIQSRQEGKPIEAGSILMQPQLVVRESTPAKGAK